MSDSHIASTLVGGSDGTLFNDIVAVTSGGQLVLDTTRPILSITRSAGWVVDGLSVTYNVKGAAKPVMIAHGSAFAGPTVTIADGEVLAAAHGRAVHQQPRLRHLQPADGHGARRGGASSAHTRWALYTRSLPLTLRVCGPAILMITQPYGNQNNSTDGDPLYVSNPIAFGGYATAQDQCASRRGRASAGARPTYSASAPDGLTGLSFFKRTPASY